MCVKMISIAVEADTTDLLVVIAPESKAPRNMDRDAREDLCGVWPFRKMDHRRDTSQSATASIFRIGEHSNTFKQKKCSSSYK